MRPDGDAAVMEIGNVVLLFEDVEPVSPLDRSHFGATMVDQSGMPPFLEPPRYCVDLVCCFIDARTRTKEEV